MKISMTNLSLGLLLSCTVTMANAADYVVQPAQSKLGFSSNFQGSTFAGSFGTWHASIQYDPNKLSADKFDVTVDLASVATGDNDRDSTLHGADFFNIAKFPQAHFVTTGFRKQGNQVIADGELTLRGVTRPMSLQVAFANKGKHAVLDVNGNLKRLDFGIGSGQYADTSVIGNDVKITAHLLLDSP